MTIVRRGDNIEDANITPYVNTVEYNRKGNTWENHHIDMNRCDEWGQEKLIEAFNIRT